jgi:hypothetical protein
MTTASTLFQLEPGESFFDSMIGDMTRRLCTQLGLHFVALGDYEGFECKIIPGTTPGDTPEVRVYTRREDLDNNDDGPSVCCVPIGGPILAPDTNGSQLATIDGKRVSLRIIRDRVFSTDVYLWGNSRAQAEALLGQTLLAFEGFHNMIEFGDEKWEDQQEDQGGVMTCGTMISFRATLRIAVSDLPTRLSRVTKTRANVTTLSETVVIRNPPSSPVIPPSLPMQTSPSD